ncbi:MAG: UbiA family prenyltransferase [Roseiflexus sp.]
MSDIFIVPGVWTAFIGVAGVLIAVIGMMQIDHARALASGLRTLPSRWGMTGRFVLGHLAALPLATVPALLIVSAGVDGMPRLLLATGALGIYLYVGIVIPRKPVTNRQREQKRLRQLTPSFVAYVRVALAGYDAPPVLLERYLARPDDRYAPMQRVVADALHLVQDRGILPFEALRRVTRDRGCRELIDVTEALAQAEAEGSDPQVALLAQETTLNQVLHDEFRRMIERRKLYLLALAALAVVSVLMQIMFVIVMGSGVMERF